MVASSPSNVAKLCAGVPSVALAESPQRLEALELGAQRLQPGTEDAQAGIVDGESPARQHEGLLQLPLQRAQQPPLALFADLRPHGLVRAEALGAIDGAETARMHRGGYQ